MFIGDVSTESDRGFKITFVKRARLAETKPMTAKRKSGSATRPAPRRIFEERGDASTKVLHRTIVVCAVGLAAVLAFAFSPRKKAAPVPASVTRTEAKAPVASFDRTSLSTKDR
jgi:hypothetical protein